MKRLRHLLVSGPVLAGTVILAGCATQPAPPPPAVVTIPPRPMPPLGASGNLPIPAVGADGLRHTVNSGIPVKQAVWNLRSAYNVAALNCIEPRYAPILAGYSAFLRTHVKTLNAANKDMDTRFKANFGNKAYIRERETYLTQVYNFFALPPVVPELCNAALALTTELAAVPEGKLEEYASTGLSRVEKPYIDFFNSYEQYRVDLAAWEARYGTSQTPLSMGQPGATVAGAQQAGGNIAN